MAQGKERLALNIKMLRKKRGCSQERLAEAVNLSAQSISDIEGCRTWVSDKTLEKLAKALGVDIFELFMPLNEDEENTPESLLHNRLKKLRAVMKEDIDARLDQFYLSEKPFSRQGGEP
ncbi:MAG: helix-turn-helix domain-containing protein [Treponema sp.]|nr:helix-turn-helix domain-containing protein [Treponema sp.]MCL2233886.1 helix-turn-helix domain-containing protein [Treponema sp.]